MKLKVLLALLPIVVIVLSCRVQPSASSTLTTNVSPEVVSTLYREEDVVIIDVRQDWEYAQGHIPGAILIPLDQLSERMSEIPRNDTVILVCRSGNRSGQAWKLLTQRGAGHPSFEQVHNMVGGMNAWVRAGYEIEICEAGNC